MLSFAFFSSNAIFVKTGDHNRRGIMDRRYVVVRPDDLPESPVRARILYCEFAAQSRVWKTPPHCHPCWQADIIMSGVCRAEASEKIFRLKQDDLIVIPPGVSHNFIYGESEIVLVSVKFDLETGGSGAAAELSPVMVSCPDLSACFGPLMETLGKCSDETESGLLISALESLSAAAVARSGFLPREGLSDTGVSKLKLTINRSLQNKITVKNAVAILGGGKRAAVERVRRNTGMTIKGLIDAERAEAAARMLLHTHRSVGEAAWMLGFPDQYTFSKFFKRMRGLAPRDFRKKQV
jgi:AraC-like DNA-binding protein/quercetin dioxygenase-like cupin family protein